MENTNAQNFKQNKRIILGFYQANVMFTNLKFTNMTHYFIKSFNLPFNREWDIYENWISQSTTTLIEKVKKDLEEEQFFEKIKVEVKNDWLIINGDEKGKYLKIEKLISI